mgnify:CR=1 FL=1
MNEQTLNELATRLEDIAAGIDGWELPARHTARLEEAAYYLRTLAPVVHLLTPLLGGLIRHQVEERRRANERRMTDELARVVEKLTTPGGTKLSAQIEAARVLDCYRDYRGAQ